MTDFFVTSIRRQRAARSPRRREWSIRPLYPHGPELPAILRLPNRPSREWRASREDGVARGV